MTEEKQNPTYLKKAAIQIAAGGTAGFVEVCIMHPLDLIKTRFQIQRLAPGTVIARTDVHLYSGIADCFRKMYKSEGIFAFWKGIVPPILAETPKRAIKFFSFDQFKPLFLFGSPVPTPLTFCLAGLCAGVTEAIFVNPFEVVKVALQANKAHKNETPTSRTVLKEIYSKQGFGLQGLQKGLTATVARNGAFNLVFFGFYHSLLGKIPQEKGSWQQFFLKAGVGFVSGTLASIVNIPFDVAKSRIQGPQPTPGTIKYRGTLKTVYLVYTEEGFRALYKGLLPKVMRLGPGGAIILLVNEHVYEYLVKY